ncbi:15233_t:CDS:2, partial [Dentiscutata erythropus]
IWNTSNKRGYIKKFSNNVLLEDVPTIILAAIVAVCGPGNSHFLTHIGRIFTIERLDQGSIPNNVFDYFLPTLVKRLGYNSVDANLPPYAIATVFIYTTLFFVSVGVYAASPIVYSWPTGDITLPSLILEGHRNPTYPTKLCSFILCWDI